MMRVFRDFRIVFRLSVAVRARGASGSGGFELVVGVALVHRMTRKAANGALSEAFGHGQPRELATAGQHDAVVPKPLSEKAPIAFEVFLRFEAGGFIRIGGCVLRRKYIVALCQEIFARQVIHALMAKMHALAFGSGS